MNRRSRGSFFPSSQQHEDEHTHACVKELQRFYDSTVIFTGIYEDGDVIHASAVGTSGIFIHRPVLIMGTGQRIKGPGGLRHSSLLHEFCRGKIFLIKLILPHHPTAREELGQKCDQVSPSSYVKMATYLAGILQNVSMADSDGKTPLSILLSRLADSATCSCHWLPVLEFLLQRKAKLREGDDNVSAAKVLTRLGEIGFSKKTCPDGCDKSLIEFLAGKAKKEGVELDTLRETEFSSKKSRFIAEILETVA